MNAIREAWMASAAPPAPLALPMQELLARLLGEARQRPIKQVMLVGAARGVGTTFIARHCAVQLAPAFGNVLMIEVRADAADEYSAIESPAALAERGPLASITMSQGTCLGLAANGNCTLPADWLDTFGLIVWDVPPLTTAPVALVLAREVDAIVLLTQAHRTRRQVALHTAQRLQESGGRLLGVVLNRSLNFIPAWIYRLL
jgi:hypothetical protein